MNIIMIDIPLYMLVNLVVTDVVNYQKYEKGFFPLLKKSGGEFGTYEDQPLHLEGSSLRPGRMIIFRFPSEQAGRDWYADADYQAFSEFRRAGTRMEFLTLVHGLPPRK